MLADALRRQRHGARVTYVRVADVPVRRSFSDAAPVAAREIRDQRLSRASLDVA